MNFWKMTVILTCRHCGGELEKRGNQTGRWYECKKCGKIIEMLNPHPFDEW
jgi:tRNA(Ile2) C34 agmatinyltransferase TiaS